jgi:hypothetical protein
MKYLTDLCTKIFKKLVIKFRTINRIKQPINSQNTYKNVLRRKFNYFISQLAKNSNIKNAQTKQLLNKNWRVTLNKPQKYYDAFIFLYQKALELNRRKINNENKKRREKENNAKPINVRIKNNKTLTNRQRLILRAIYGLNKSVEGVNSMKIIRAKRVKIVNTPSYQYNLSGTALYDAYKKEAKAIELAK